MNEYSGSMAWMNLLVDENGDVEPTSLVKIETDQPDCPEESFFDEQEIVEPEIDSASTVAVKPSNVNQYTITTNLTNIEYGTRTKILQQAGAEPDQYELQGDENRTEISGLSGDYNMSTGVLTVTSADARACSRLIGALNKAKVQNYQFKQT